MKPAPKNVDEYLALVPQSLRPNFLKLRSALLSAAPKDALEVISYGIPAIKRNNKVLVLYACFADHFSLFPRHAVIEEFKDELKGYKTSKGTIQFPLDKPLPLGLIKQMVKVRVEMEKQERRPTADRRKIKDR